MSEADAKPQPSPWRRSALILDQSVTTQTLGVGADYQSDNPTYDWLLRLIPRYYLVSTPELQMHVRASVGLTQELTAGDGVTRRRELDAPDSLLSLRTSRTVLDVDGHTTLLDVGLPELVIPTSRASRLTGSYGSVGLALYPTHIISMDESPLLQSLMVIGLARYRYQFVSATEPVSDSVARPRTDIAGRPVVTDQLGSPAFTQHEMRLGGQLIFEVTSRLAALFHFEWRPTWKYPFDRQAEVCVLTGCVEPDSVESPQRFRVTTVFAAQVEAQVLDELSVGVGYENVANQLGPDGRRRSFLYSPDARFVLSLSADLDALFRDANPTGNKFTQVRPGAPTATF